MDGALHDNETGFNESKQEDFELLGVLLWGFMTSPRPTTVLPT